VSLVEIHYIEQAIERMPAGVCRRGARIQQEDPVPAAGKAMRVFKYYIGTAGEAGPGHYISNIQIHFFLMSGRHFVMLPAASITPQFVQGVNRLA
jgi:hypothetical protein